MRLSVSKMECSGKVKSTIAVAEQRSRRFGSAWKRKEVLSIT